MLMYAQKMSSRLIFHRRVNSCSKRYASRFIADQRPDNPLRKEELNPEKKIVVYCGVGNQGTLSTKTLQDMGYSDVSNLTGGTKALVKAGFNLKK